MAVEPTEYKAALYMRLSKDDECGGESESIVNQRNMLNSYAREHGYKVVDEYIDDGWSGTNFERPEFKRMLRDIDHKKINLILTKDLSRLGRDYIAAGQYTEIYFPAKGVRCIAVNDGYDSIDPNTDIAPFKNIINEMYARDTSRKIRSAFLAKMREGSFIGSFAPYGYQKDPENKNRLVRDPIAGPVVCEMFRMSASGSSPADIAKAFNEKGILTPAVYRCSSRPFLDADKYSKRKEWTSSMICKMLKNIVYLGHTAQGKTKKTSFKSAAVIQKPQEEWIIVENTHEALLDKETFDRAGRRCVPRNNLPRTDFFNIFSGIAKCADCGRNMSASGTRKKGSSASLVCGGYKLYGKKECLSHYIDYDILYRLVLTDLRKHIRLSDEKKREVLGNLAQNRENKTDSETVKLINSLKTRDRELDLIIKKLYEDNVGGKLSDKRFEKLLRAYEAEQSGLSSKISLISRDLSIKQNTYEKSLRSLEKLCNLTELDFELLHTLIDRIEICRGSYESGKRGGVKLQTIRIFYKFADEKN